MGKFYELFEMDAHVGAKELDLQYMKVINSLLLIQYTAVTAQSSFCFYSYGITVSIYSFWIISC